ncbi:MAG: glycosyltransferase, partial [Odoribacter sp.]
IYHLPAHTPIDFIPNPIHIPDPDTIDFSHKKTQVVFLGRLDSVKRPWIIGEIAKKMPKYDFYFAGDCHEQVMNNIMAPYRKISNCHFLGHIEGKEKDQLLRESMILINTSIHEAIPVSFLEALSYGLLIVSNRNPDDLTSQFGYYTQQINGNGYTSINEFIQGIQSIIRNQKSYYEKAQQAMSYVHTVHSIEHFIQNIRQIIIDEYNNTAK